MIASVHTPQLEEVLSKAECVFAAIWNGNSEAIATEQIATYYEVPTNTVLEILQLHFAEFNLTNDQWNPRDTIRLGFLLDSPVATQVRSLALDLVEAHKSRDKKAAVAFLLQNTEIVQWSNRAIAKIADCSHTVVNRVRQDLENQNKVVKFEKRKYSRNGATLEQSATKESVSQPSSGNLFPDSAQKPDYSVSVSAPKVKVTSPSHFRYGEEGEIDGEPPNHWQQIVKFADGSREAIANRDLDAPSMPIERKLPPGYKEAIAQLEQQHQEEIVQLEQQLRAGIKTEAEELAQESLKEKITALEALASQKAAEASKLQQKVVELESLRRLEVENQQLRQRIQELEQAMPAEAIASFQNHNFTSEAKKVLNTQVTQLLEKVEKNLEPELHLRLLAQEAPNNPREVVLLIGRSLSHLKGEKSQKAASVLLGCEPEQLSEKLSQLEHLGEAIASIQSAKNWDEVQAVGERFPLIKNEVWLELSAEKREAIANMKPVESSEGFHVGDRVSVSDPYTVRYTKVGTVIGFVGDGAVLVEWDDLAHVSQHNYEPSELRYAELNQE